MSIPYRLLGPRALALLRKNVQAIVDAWQGDWFVPGPASATVSLAVHPLDSADLETATEYQWRYASAGEQALYLGLRGLKLTRLARCFLSDPMQEDPHPLLDHIASDALDNLLERFVPVKETPATGTEGGPPHAFVEQGSGASRVVLNVNDVTIELWLNAALTLQFAPNTTIDNIDLAPADSCLQNQPVTLSIELDLGTVSADRLESLRAGDVIATSAPMHNTFAVVLPHTGRIASGRLGKQAETCVVVLDQ